MEILISYAPYRHQRYSSTNSLKRTAVCMVKERVCFPYEFTLLSNVAATCTTDGKFVSPTNLHCSQTLISCLMFWMSFVSPTNLHCSQTSAWEKPRTAKFVSPTNLHCSQTQGKGSQLHNSLFPLRIYTALKHYKIFFNCFCCLFPLRIYTALKPQIVQE